MFRLEEQSSFEQIIKKSTFRAVATPVDSEEAAKAALQTIATAAGANHNCWAWRIGQAYRFSDDGEPSGTAGKPILAAIDGQSVDCVLLVVSRWFGGVLLGTGGLVRAYGGTAAACLRAATLTAFTPMIVGQAKIQFGDLALVKARLASFDQVRIVEQHFTDDGCDATVQLPQEAVQAVAQLINDLTNGRSAFRTGD
ncbi:IMPACT family protein (plasmid) [Rhizobium sp. CB3090]|uniref:IMPACT family protein n=1 Tax=Rhizobium sp. CB3090 TaxID=3039156 RepID=UPI0024B22873|nr:YigZ family protein [Rhizobium sp. CB3090]WFU12556.1 IMPACT family protein [Rhizobium sp. CB3090]